MCVRVRERERERERERDRKGVEERERKNIHFTVVAPHLSQLCDGRKNIIFVEPSSELRAGLGHCLL